MARIKITTDSGEVIAEFNDDNRLQEDASEGAIGDLSYSFARTALVNAIREAVAAAGRRWKSDTDRPTATCPECDTKTPLDEDGCRKLCPNCGCGCWGSEGDLAR